MMSVMPSAPNAGALRGGRRVLAALFMETSPLDLRILGRTLLHAALVGALSGLVAVLFFGGLEFVEVVLLGHLTGYTRLRAYGETMLESEAGPFTFRPW